MIKLLNSRRIWHTYAYKFHLLNDRVRVTLGITGEYKTYLNKDSFEEQPAKIVKVSFVCSWLGPRVQNTETAVNYSFCPFLKGSGETQKLKTFSTKITVERNDQPLLAVA